MAKKKDKENKPEEAAAQEGPAQPQPQQAEETKPETASQPQNKDDFYKEEIASLEAKTDELRDSLLRAMAETENVRKRLQKEAEDAGKYAVTGFAKDLISVLENLQRAEDSIPADARSQDGMLKKLHEGVELTRKELLSVFERKGIKRLNPVGEKFDHNFHQAVAQVEAADSAPGTVVQVLQAGYIIHDRLLKPAIVTVAKATEPEFKLDTIA